MNDKYLHIFRFHIEETDNELPPLLSQNTDRLDIASALRYVDMIQVSVG